MGEFLSGGGSISLAKIIDLCGEYVYSDLLRYYRIDLMRLFDEDDPLQPVVVLSLVKGLPPDSATMAHIRELPEAYGWNIQTYLLAALVDAVRDNTQANQQLHSKKKLKPFKRLEVPDVNRSKRKPANSFVAMAQAAFARGG